MKAERQEIAPAWGKVPEVARHAGVSSRLVRRWITERLLPCSRMPSGLVLVRLQDVDEFLLRYQGDEIPDENKPAAARLELSNKADEIVKNMMKSCE